MQGIILLGGKGTRLQSLYPDRPKALAPVAGRPFLAWQLEWLARGGVTDVHLAAGHLADRLEAWLRGADGERGAEDGVRCSGDSVPGSAGNFVDKAHDKARDKDPASRGSKKRAAQARHRSDAESAAPCPMPHAPCGLDRITMSVEPRPLGTGGGLRLALPHLRSDRVLVVNGDSLLPNLDFQALEKKSESFPSLGNAAGGPRPAALAVVRIEEAGRYGTVTFDAERRVTAFREKAQHDAGWVNGGVYLLPRRVIEQIPAGRAVSLETEFFPSLAAAGALRAIPCPPPLLDMGTPEGLRAMEQWLTATNS